MAAAVLVALAGCAAPPPKPSAGPVVSNPPLDTLQVDFGGGHVLTAELADDHEERILGLMNRPQMAPDAGMLFVFPAASSGGFWMKNTLIPLQIAYLERDGDTTFEVLKILDMVPCRADPCDPYPPGMAYDAALEVNEGWFSDAGIEPGDRAEVSRPV